MSFMYFFHIFHASVAKHLAVHTHWTSWRWVSLFRWDNGAHEAKTQRRQFLLEVGGL